MKSIFKSDNVTDGKMCPRPIVLSLTFVYQPFTYQTSHDKSSLARCNGLTVPSEILLQKYCVNNTKRINSKGPRAKKRSRFWYS